MAIPDVTSYRDAIAVTEPCDTGILEHSYTVAVFGYVNLETSSQHSTAETKTKIANVNMKQNAHSSGKH